MTSASSGSLHAQATADDDVALRRATLLVAALEGAISHAVFEEPDWLRAPWFLDELAGVAAPSTPGSTAPELRPACVYVGGQLQRGV